MLWVVLIDLLIVEMLWVVLIDLLIVEMLWVVLIDLLIVEMLWVVLIDLSEIRSCLQNAIPAKAISKVAKPIKGFV
jgi:hypothetical protein